MTQIPCGRFRSTAQSGSRIQPRCGRHLLVNIGPLMRMPGTTGALVRGRGPAPVPAVSCSCRQPFLGVRAPVPLGAGSRNERYLPATACGPKASCTYPVSAAEREPDAALLDATTSRLRTRVRTWARNVHHAVWSEAGCAGCTCTAFAATSGNSMPSFGVRLLDPAHAWRQPRRRCRRSEAWCLPRHMRRRLRACGRHARARRAQSSDARVTRGCIVCVL